MGNRFRWSLNMPRRILIYCFVWLSTFLLTPMVFFFENDFQLAFWLTANPYAFHWVPEIISLVFFGLLLTSVGESCRDRHPQTQAKIQQVCLLGFFTLGSFLLGINLLVFGILRPTAFIGFFWGSLPLLGCLIETKVIDHAD